jgi:hypothetical protein
MKLEARLARLERKRLPIDLSEFPSIFVVPVGPMDDTNKAWETVRSGNREWRVLPGETREEFQSRICREGGGGVYVVLRENSLGCA